jgi:hypothetical protein
MPDEASAPAAKPRKKSWMVLVLFVGLLLLLFLPPRITIGHFQRRLESTMSAAVGRPVTIRYVHPRLLPQPGFDLDGFVIQDDPALSSEPLLRSDSVTADLRLLSLWRGRIEISKLTLQNPSLNLVRGRDGHWNVEALFVRAAQIPSAPTAKRIAEARPRFPYIEADSGRINFKNGEEKKVYAFSDADFALWLAAENEWELRLKATPIRTDRDLGDTGTLRVSGRIERATSAAEMPLHLKVTWQDAQLGQLTELVYGRDRGWRGTVNGQASLSGSPQSLNVEARAVVNDFRRYDIGSSDSFNAEVDCNAIYSRLQAGAQENSPLRAPPSLRATCSTSRGNGVLTVTFDHSFATSDSSTKLLAAAFPLSDVIALAKHMKRGIAPDLKAEGVINGLLVINHGNVQPASSAPDAYTLTARAQLDSRSLTGGVDLGILVFNFQQAGTMPPARTQKSKPSTSIFTLALLPSAVELGAGKPLVVSGIADAKGFDLHLEGEAHSERLQQTLLALGLPPPVISPRMGGKSKVKLDIDGTWAGFPAPETVGWVRPEAPTALARSKIQ